MVSLAPCSRWRERQSSSAPVPNRGAGDLDVGNPGRRRLLAEALVVVKAFPAVHPVAMNAVSMAVGASILLVLSAVFGEALARPESTTTLAAQAYLVLAGSVLVFWLYIVVVQRWTASAASYQLVLIPLVTVVVSAWLQDDPITPAFAAGSVLVLLGVYVGALRRPAMREAPSPQPD